MEDKLLFFSYNYSASNNLTAQRNALLALGRAWILFESRKKLEARKMFENAAESPASSSRCVSQPFG